MAPARRRIADVRQRTAHLVYPQEVIAAALASIFLGVVATLGDFAWAYFNVRHRPAYGLIHGAAFCLAIGAAIGVRTGKILPASMAGPVVGVIAAASFYLLAPALGMRAMFPAWMLFWILFALLQRWLRDEPLGRTLTRGLAAAVLSGLAFYAISGIWTEREPGGPNYVRNLLSWTFAFFPGFAALFFDRRRIV